MFRRLLPLLTAQILCWSQACLAAPDCPQPLRVGFLDTPLPPQLMGQGAAFPDPPGWQVQAIRNALKRLDCPAELLRMPSRRLTSSLSLGQIDFAVMYAPTPERLQTMRFPLNGQGKLDLAWAPVIGHMVLFARAGVANAAPGWDGRLPEGWRVGAMSGSAYEAVARERGWNIEPISAFELGQSMLQARRFDLLLLNREAMPNEHRAAVSEWAMVDLLPLFVPAAPDFAKRHPAWTQAFWQEVCQSVRRLEPGARSVECGVAPPEARR